MYFAIFQKYLLPVWNAFDWKKKKILFKVICEEVLQMFLKYNKKNILV